jgi:hypothetical protein
MMFIIHKDPEQILLDLETLEQKVQELSSGVEAYATFLLLKVLDFIEKEDYASLKHTFITYLEMKEQLDEFKAQQKQGWNGEQGSSS